MGNYETCGSSRMRNVSLKPQVSSEKAITVSTHPFSVTVMKYLRLNTFNQNKFTYLIILQIQKFDISIKLAVLRTSFYMASSMWYVSKESIT